MVMPIHVEGLAAGYGGTRIWEGLDMDIDEPGLVCILGPNGVGKSTFIYILDKILAPMEGKVTIGGRDIAEMDRREIASIVAYVPQGSEETFSMSVLDTVMMGRYPVSGFVTSKEDLLKVSQCMKAMGVTDLASKRFDELSAGQHQKVMIARGLAQEPAVLLLDEPTSNLDIFHQLHVMRTLRDIALREGMIVI